MTTVDLIEDFGWIESTPKKEAEPINFVQDPVALTLASYRSWQDTGIRWMDFDNVKVIEQDIARADQLRKYYAGTMTFDALKGEGLRTTFRRKLYAIVTNCHQYRKDDIGLLYRLPYLYEEDLALDQLTTEFQSHNYTPSKEVVGTFSLHKKMLLSRRAGEYYHYWLKNQDNQYLYKIVVKADDSLRSLVESLLEIPRQFSATVYWKGMSGRRRFNYLQLGNMKLA